MKMPECGYNRTGLSLEEMQTELIEKYKKQEFYQVGRM